MPQGMATLMWLKSSFKMGLSTPMGFAADYGHKEIVEFLVHHGCDINAKDNDGDTALSMATKKGHDEIVKFLRSQPNIALNTDDSDDIKYMPPKKLAKK